MRIAICFALLTPAASLNIKKDPLDSVAAEEFEGSDMIPLFPAGQIPGALPKTNAAAGAFVKQQFIDHVVCHVEYKKGGNIYLIREPRLKPYLLERNGTDGSKRPVVLVVPGGGNGFLAWHREGSSVAEWLNSIGLDAFVLAYRVPSDPKNQNMDAQRAVSWLRYNAEKYGLDPSRVLLMGFSAGGQIASDLSLSKDRAYEAIDEVDKLDYHSNFDMLVYGLPSPPFTKWHRMPPPTFSISAKDDPCVPAFMPTMYCDQVNHHKGTECERHVYANGGHGYGTCALYTNENSGTAACEWTDHAAQWLKRHRVL